MEGVELFLVLRRYTLRIIDGAGSDIEASKSESSPQERVGGKEAERVSSPNAPPEKSNSAIRERTDLMRKNKTLFIKEAHMNTIADELVSIQVSSESAPSMP